MPRDTFPPFRVDVSVLFGKAIPARGHRVDWIVQSAEPARRGREERFGNGRAWVGPSVAGDHAVAKAVRFVQRLAHETTVLLRARRGYDVVQSKDEFVGALLALAAARWSGARFVYWLSFPFPEDWVRSAAEGEARYPRINRLRGWLFGRLLYRVLLPAADLVFVQSPQMRDDIAAHGIEVDKLCPVPMGVEEHLLEGDAEPAVEPTVVYLGTMVRTRRIELVLDAFARVLAAMPAARLLMVGGEPDEVGRLRDYAVTLGIAGRVVFTGKVTRDEALARVREAHVGVSPFCPTPVLDSTSPTKLMEYFALGRPAVANEHPEQTRVIAESGGGLCVPYRADAFAEAMLTLLRDSQRARSMGRRAREYARQRAYPIIAGYVIKRYQRLLAERPAALRTSATRRRGRSNPPLPPR